MVPDALDWWVLLIIAPFIGSFLSVLVVRLPKGEDVVASRSQCRSCGKRLSPLELLPVVSWLIQGGKCRQCGAKIGWFYPAIEIGAAVVVLWAVSVGMEGWILAATCLLGWMLLALGAMDLRDFVLADVLTLPLIVMGLAVVWLSNGEAVVWHAAAAVAGFALMVGIAAAYKQLRGREGLGFGDAKLMAAAGAWTGLAGLGTVLLYGSLLTLALAGILRQTGREIGGETPLPFGAGLAMGLWLTWLYGPLLLG
jgi:leader peptidase (prepilin peptidase)/N-methyltransferase